MPSHSRPFYLGLIFSIGFVALVYQLYSVRVLFMFFAENTHAVATAISSFLAGLACSSMLFSRYARHNTRNLRLVCGMMIAGGAYGILALSHYDWIPQWVDFIHRAIANPWLALPVQYAVMWIYLFLPAFFLGGAFPLINGLYLASLEESARDTGTVYFWDTLGAIAGAFVAGFVLLPMFGLQLTVMAAATINLLIGFVLMPRTRLSAVAAVILVVMAGWGVMQTLSHPAVLFSVTPEGDIRPADEGEPPKLEARFGQVLFQKESPFGRVTVGSSGATRSMFLNYRGMCQQQQQSGNYTGRLPPLHVLSHVIRPMLPRESEVLDIGLGCGFTASELAFDKNTRRLDIVEINPVIVEASRHFDNQGVLDAPNVSLHVANGADWLRNTPTQYDAILIDIEEPSVMYSSPLYTEEYFTLMRHRLKENGVLGFWSFIVTPEFTRVLYNTLARAFPYVVMRRPSTEQATLYYASMHLLDVPADAQLFSGDQSFSEVMALRNTQVNTVEHPVLEHYVDMNSLFELPKDYRERFIE